MWCFCARVCPVSFPRCTEGRFPDAAFRACLVLVGRPLWCERLGEEKREGREGKRNKEKKYESKSKEWQGGNCRLKELTSFSMT